MTTGVQWSMLCPLCGLTSHDLDQQSAQGGWLPSGILMERTGVHYDMFFLDKAALVVTTVAVMELC